VAHTTAMSNSASVVGLGTSQFGMRRIEVTIFVETLKRYPLDAHSSGQLKLV
jgi:hypothetical protein